MLRDVSYSNGSVWDVDISHDPPHTWLYNADGENNHVETLLRESGKVLAKFGRNGRQAGEFDRVHNLAVDSRGNIYTTEVDTGKRARRSSSSRARSPSRSDRARLTLVIPCRWRAACAAAPRRPSYSR